MAVVYTHDFNFVLGGKAFEGEVEFNEDGITTFKLSSTAEDKTLQEDEMILSLFKTMREALQVYGSITSIEVTEK